MASILNEHLYNYQFASDVDSGVIQLAAAGGAVEVNENQDSGNFFAGQLHHPREVSTLLLTLSTIVRTHFFDARPPQMDPIVTASHSLLRWEGFSGCCGAYTRLDLEQKVFDVEQQRFGTTNVDFNPAMLAHLGSVGRSDDVKLSISADAVTMERNQSAVTEKRVRLPQRWIKGLGEVQVYQSRLKLRHRFTPAALMPLVQNSRRDGSGMQHLLLTTGKPRLSTRESAHSVAVGGLSRLSVLRTILPIVREVSLYVDDNSGVHAWVGETDWARFWLVLSPTLQRGFSGEGQVLESLADEQWVQRIDSIRNLLAVSEMTTTGPVETIDPAEIAVRLGCTTDEATQGLAALATNGLAGFDADSGFYFQRQLPFEFDHVLKDQPRLLAAKKLIEGSAVQLLSYTDPASVDAEVGSKDVTYFVRLRSDGDRCTCPWFSRHQGQRGPCKHVLATRIALKMEHHD